MRIRATAIGLTLIAVALVGAATANGGGATYPTTIVADHFDDSDSVPSADYASGRIESPKRRCLGGRTVKLYLGGSGDFTLLDETRTSANGYWAAGGDNNIGNGGKVVVTRKKLGSGKACGKGMDSFD